MTRQVSKSRAQAKSARGTNRNQKSTIRNQVSPIVLALREILQAETRGMKAAYALVPIVERPLDSCRKILHGTLPLNAETLSSLLRSEFGDRILDALMGGGQQPRWYRERMEDSEVIAISREANALQERAKAMMKGRVGG